MEQGTLVLRIKRDRREGCGAGNALKLDYAHGERDQAFFFALSLQFPEAGSRRISFVLFVCHFWQTNNLEAEASGQQLLRGSRMRVFAAQRAAHEMHHPCSASEMLYHGSQQCPGLCMCMSSPWRRTIFIMSNSYFSLSCEGLGSEGGDLRNTTTLLWTVVILKYSLNYSY